MGLNVEGLKQKDIRTGGNTWKPNIGDNWVRLLPPTTKYFSEEIDFIAYFARLHYFKADGMDTVAIRCEKDRKGFCLACEVSARHSEDVDPIIKKKASDLYASKTWYIRRRQEGLRRALGICDQPRVWRHHERRLPGTRTAVRAGDDGP
jgi:hypothetical protein